MPDTDTKCRTQDTGHKMPDTRCRTQDAGHKMPDTKWQTQNAGHNCRQKIAETKHSDMEY